MAATLSRPVAEAADEPRTIYIALPQVQTRRGYLVFKRCFDFTFALLALIVLAVVPVIAVADVFTALTEDRPYRNGMPLAEAMGIIVSMTELGYLDNDVVALLADNVLRVNKERIRAQRKAAANFVVMRRLCDEAAKAARQP